MINLFKYKFVCKNKENILYRIEQIKNNELPCGKTLWGSALYKEGIHFQEVGDKIKGFFLNETENKSHRGSPLRICFQGEFKEEAGILYFNVVVYPRIFEAIFLLFTFCCFASVENVIGTIIGIAFMSIFLKEYYDLIKNTYQALNKIFK